MSEIEGRDWGHSSNYFLVETQGRGGEKNMHHAYITKHLSTLGKKIITKPSPRLSIHLPIHYSQITVKQFL